MDNENEMDFVQPLNENYGKQNLTGQLSWNRIASTLFCFGICFALGIFVFSGKDNEFVNDRLLATLSLISIVSIISLAILIVLVQLLYFLISKGEWLAELDALPKCGRSWCCKTAIFLYGIVASVCSIVIGFGGALHFLLVVSGKIFYIFKVFNVFKAF